MKRYLFFVCVAGLVACVRATGGMFQRDSAAYFKVTDYDGSPISNAVVKINTMKKWIPGENFGRTIYMDVAGKSDANGDARVEFLCKSLNFTYSVDLEGYYGTGGGVGFARAGRGFMLRQTQFETNLVAKLKPVKKPIPMYVLRQIMHHPLRYPGRASRGWWGVDLKVGDWIKPNGKGEIADFFVEYSETHFDKDRAIDCALVFTNALYDGCYVAKCTGTRFRSDYAANTNAVYLKRLDFVSWGKKYKGRYATELLDEDEYLVLRTRTKTTEDGNFVSAHYSKIYGPIHLKGGFYSKGTYFNPNENDTNLEANTKVNLMPGGSVGFAP